MEDKTQQIEELQLTLRAFLEKYPKNVTVYQDMCNFELSSEAHKAYASILADLHKLGAEDVIYIELHRMFKSHQVKQQSQQGIKS